MSQTTTTKGLPKAQRGERLFELNTGSVVGVRGKTTDRVLRRLQTAVSTYQVTPATFRDTLGKVNRSGYVRVLFGPGDYNLGDALDITADGVQFMATVPGAARLVLDSPGTKARGHIVTARGADFVLSGLVLYDAVGSTYSVTCLGERAVVERCTFEDGDGAVYLQGSGHTLRDCTVLNSRNTEAVYLFNADSAVVIGNRLMAGTSGNRDLYCNSGSNGCSLVGNVAEPGGGTLTYFIASGTVEAGNVFGTISALP